MDRGGWLPLTSLYEMIHYVHFMYVCDLARGWCPPTSFLRTTPLFTRLVMCAKSFEFLYICMITVWCFDLTLWHCTLFSDYGVWYEFLEAFICFKLFIFCFLDVMKLRVADIRRECITYLLLSSSCCCNSFRISLLILFISEKNLDTFCRILINTLSSLAVTNFYTNGCIINC